jgi:hypothetical protein
MISRITYLFFVYQDGESNTYVWAPRACAQNKPKHRYISKSDCVGIGIHLGWDARDDFSSGFVAVLPSMTVASEYLIGRIKTKQ